MPWQVDGANYALNMIDTPGHVDFTYEVSRSLAACEGAILLVDAAQGIEAQTLANLYLAMENDLTIIPVLNKIDLPGAAAREVRSGDRSARRRRPRRRAARLRQDRRRCRGPAGSCRADLPSPRGEVDAPCRAMIFDSVYDTYRGVVTYVAWSTGR